MINCKSVRKIIYPAFVFFSLMSLTGCTGRELDQLAIVTCAEITRYDGLYHIQAEIVRLSDPDKEPGSDAGIIYASGKTLSECIDALNEAEVLHIYLGHMRLIIFDRSFLDSAGRSELEEIADFSVRNSEIRFNTELAVSYENFGEAVSAESASTVNTGIDLSNRIRELGLRSELCDFINCLDGFSQPPSLPVITVSDMNDNKIVIVRTRERYRCNFS